MVNKFLMICSLCTIISSKSPYTSDPANDLIRTINKVCDIGTKFSSAECAVCLTMAAETSNNMTRNISHNTSH